MHTCAPWRVGREHPAPGRIRRVDARLAEVRLEGRLAEVRLEGHHGHDEVLKIQPFDVGTPR
eukprot:SAG31_NODE_788_length_12088_cov_3.916090_12_plen_62_part_00